MDKANQKAYRITFVGIVINVFLSGIKFLAGIFGRSEAIIADALHSLSDLTTDLAVLIGFKGAEKPIDKSHDYGHGKIETLVAAFIGIILFLVGGKILIQGGQEVAAFLRGETMPAPEWFTCLAAAISIGMKEVLYRKTVSVGQEIKSRAIVANAWHHRSDALSSVAVLCGISGAIVLGPRWRVLDPLAAICVSLLIMYMAFSVLKESLNELMEASLDDEVEDEIIAIIGNIPGVKYPHNLKTRRIGRNMAIDIHIKVSKDLNIMEAHNISTSVEETLRRRFGQEIFVYVHVEPAL